MEAEINQRLIEAALRQRGFRLDSDSHSEGILLPQPCSPEAWNRYYHLLKRYSFRIFLRDVIKFAPYFEKSHLLHYCSERKAEAYLTCLIELGMIEKTAQGYHLIQTDVKNFGDTLEFYLARIFQQEFLAPAAWRVKLKGNFLGGDFDLITLLSSRLVFIEITSSPPRNVHQESVTEFLHRYQLLAPDLCIFFIDTHLRLPDKINKMICSGFQEITKTNLSEPLRLKSGLFRLLPGLYSMNSKPDIVVNLRTCLQHYFSAAFLDLPNSSR